MYCSACGVEAMTKMLTFKQDIGIIAIRLHKDVEGSFCKSCMHKFFWQTSLITVFFGWWSFPSLLIAPYYLINNIVQYLASIKMEPVAFGANYFPNLNELNIAKMNCYQAWIFQERNKHHSIDTIAQELSNKADVTKAEATLYINALTKKHIDEDNTEDFVSKILFQSKG
jgi:hypothetical protein